MRSALILGLSVGLAQTASAQSLAMSADVRWQPERPAQGTMIYVIVDPHADGSRVSVNGNMAGQPLHFERDAFGEFRALAPVPVGALETIPLSLSFIERADTSHRVVIIPIQPVEFRSSNLSVSSRFSTPPDSALQARISAESAQSARVYRTSHDTPRMWTGAWVRPRGSRITSEFGVKRLLNGRLRSRHLGVDFDGETGDPIVAGNRGVIALVGDFYYSGNVVYLDHGNGLVTIYMHMSEVDVEQGQVVERGHQIGKVGATGRVTGPHVHWHTRYGRISVDGLSLLELEPVDYVESSDQGEQ